MKLPKHIKEAEIIGKNSYELIYYPQLSKRASIKKQVDALEREKHWQENHHIEVMHQIDMLIRDIEEGKPK